MFKAMEKKLKKVYQNTDKKVLGKKFGRLTPIKRINFDKGYSRYIYADATVEKR